MALAQRFEGDGGIDEPVAEIAQRLPQRGAAAGALFDAGKGFGAGLARPDNLPERFFEKQVAAKLGRCAAALGLESERQLVESQQLNVKQRQTPLPAQKDLQAAA